LEKEGIEFITSCNVGIDITASQLRAEYNAIVLAGGSTIPRDLPVPGRDLNGIHFAMDFLSQQNKRVSKIKFDEPDLLAKDKRVLVIGGGDTGSDCIGTSNRQGAKSILQFELLGKPPTSRDVHNPWPEWPMTLRTSTSHEEGCEREWSILTKEFMGENGRVNAVRTVKVSWEGGQLRELEGSEETYPVDLVLLAMGFIHPQKDGLLEQLKVELDDRGNVLTEDYHTSVQSVFAAGDVRRGQSLVVWAISEGREAARAVDLYLTRESKLPAKNISEYQL
jgi:glutamate synthase (NADPH/NADH) small chain